MALNILPPTANLSFDGRYQTCAPPSPPLPSSAAAVAVTAVRVKTKTRYEQLSVNAVSMSFSSCSCTWLGSNPTAQTDRPQPRTLCGGDPSSSGGGVPNTCLNCWRMGASGKCLGWKSFLIWTPLLLPTSRKMCWQPSRSLFCPILPSSKGWRESELNKFSPKLSPKLWYTSRNLI